MDSKGLGGHKLVMFEELSLDGKQVASHEDPSDEGQTVTVVEIGTTLVDSSDGDHVIVSGKVKLTDTIEYEGLVPDETCTVHGALIVSTHEQTMALQEDALVAAGCEKIYRDVCSGSKASRPALDEMLKCAREGDAIVVWKLDRFGRSLKNLVEQLEMLDNRGVRFKSLQDGFDTNTSAGRLQRHIIASMAEFERDLIRERTTAGLKAARARGRYGGRPKASKGKIELALKMCRSNDCTVAEIVKATGVSKSTIYRYANCTFDRQSQ